ncbi:PQQ-binding-like beta-propeller repeat protein [Kribbella sp. NPDC051718]|uniref:PQQ-binding-like beta-propeller repeat protein n=1 Tax=Kribbella sp. NPDC051718 TaxID=3155168 RepID=UPI0034177935
MRALLTAALAALLLAPLTAAQASEPPPPTPVSLGIPLSDVLLIGGTVAPGPVAGKAAIWNVSTGKPGYLNAMDPATGASLVSAPLEGADSGYAVTATPDGSIYVGTYSNGHLYRWRPGMGDTVEDLGRPVASENYIWSLTSDEHGNIYGGTFPGGKIFRYDAATGAVRDYGQAVHGQTYVRSIAYATGKVYAGTNPDAHLVELDPATGTVSEIPSPPGIPDIRNLAIYDLAARAGKLYARFSTAYPAPLCVFDLATRTWTDQIPAAHGLDISPVGDQGEIYLIQQGELKRYDPATKALAGTGLTFTGRIQNARAIGWAELGLPDYPGKSIVGTLWRGELFRYNPQTGKSDLIQSAVRREPIEILSVAGGKQSAYVGGFLNGGVSVVNPLTGAATFNRFSQTEALMEASDGRVWIGNYPEARVYSYDPHQPWSSPEYSPGPPGTPDNPRLEVNMKADQQMRARAFAEVDGKIAIGTVPEGDRLGGALAIHDPVTRTTQTFRNVVQDESIFGLAADHGIVYGGTSITGGLTTTPPTRAEGTVFAWDVRHSRKLWETPIAGAGTVNSVAIGPDGLLWGVAGKTIFAVDTLRGRLKRRFDLGSTTACGDIVATRDALYAGIDGTKLYKLAPWQRTPPAVWLTQANRRLAVQGDNQLLVTTGAQLFRIDLNR